MKFSLQLFGGSKGSKTVVQNKVPEQTRNEKDLENALIHYDIPVLGTAGNLVNQANGSIANTYNPNYNQLGNNFNNAMNTAGNQYNTGMNDVANGILPSEYAANRQKALQSDLTNTVGSTIAGLGSRGIINSSVTNGALNQISQNASNTLANSYANDLNQQSNILGQRYNNQMQGAGNIITGNVQNQAGSYQQPTNIFGYAANLVNPAHSLYDTMYSGRMKQNAGQTSQTSGGGGNVWGAIGSIGGSIIGCFTGDTLITTDKGDKPISEVKVGDKVLSATSEYERVAFVRKPKRMPLLYVTTDNSLIKTTTSQRLFDARDGKPYPIFDIGIGKYILTKQGKEMIKMIRLYPEEKELVYDFTTEETNTFFANGVLSEGW